MSRNSRFEKYILHRFSAYFHELFIIKKTICNAGIGPGHNFLQKNTVNINKNYVLFETIDNN